ncbi:conserved hypothetical protein [Nitrospina gracilis 3/211]|uniref:DUF3592 domain-containing protein n=1 Tax=Nitrospina gracilis (strain 3/211) TaxID=1266370 RepID=M1YYJ4_NITG3|nr:MULTISPECIES: DUF3592 domain-containing protein [Nitrospina]MCF8723677.1 hypothetical protein [Nitrospina sp. Nb-3]CCQ90765.1 conserved hypothetical protein [Nitrospina gracilis 3/211]
MVADWMGLIFAVAGLGAVVYAWRIRNKAESARFWPVATGKVQRSSIKLERGGGYQSSNSTYRADVRYRYRVGGRSYSNNKILIGGQLQMGFRSRAEEHCRRYPVGTEVEVLYNPDNPQEACLEAREETSGFLQLVGGGFAVFGVMMYLGLLPF